MYLAPFHDLFMFHLVSIGCHLFQNCFISIGLRGQLVYLQQKLDLAVSHVFPVQDSMFPKFSSKRATLSSKTFFVCSILRWFPFWAQQFAVLKLPLTMLNKFFCCSCCFILDTSVRLYRMWLCLQSFQTFILHFCMKYLPQNVKKWH